jgi:DNA-binding NarL/FixJ family response regulator
MLHAARDRSLQGVITELEPLSTRQLEILRRLLDGDRVPAIARDLYVSASTVRNHLSSIFRKLGVHSQEELLRLLRSIQVAQMDAIVSERQVASPSLARTHDLSDSSGPTRG